MSRLPATVVGLGLVSLLTDASSETIFPLLPAFLSALGASNTFIGIVEGAADLVSNVLKYATGIAADRLSRTKPLVLAGYALSTVARPLVAFAAAPWHVLAVRLIDRVGKGVRTTPRDALIARATPPAIRGRAYGFHRAMDHAGAALGTVLGVGLLWSLGTPPLGTASADVLRRVFLLAAIPGVLAIVALALTPEPAAPAAPRGGEGAGAALPPALRRALVPIAIFGLANATDAFLLVKAARLGLPTAAAPLLWLALHVIKASLATTGGRLADRYGRRNALVLGWLVYAVTWAAVGLVRSPAALVAASAAYGVSHALVEGPERALVAELAGRRARGRAFGVYNMLVGLAALVASTAFGAVWDALGDTAAFTASAALATLASALLWRVVPSPIDPG